MDLFDCFRRKYLKMRRFFVLVFSTGLVIGCANQHTLSQSQNLSVHSSVSLAQIDERRETLNLKPITTSGYLEYREHNDQFSKSYFVLWASKFDFDIHCTLDPHVPQLLIMKSELPKKYRNYNRVKVTLSGVFENKKSDSIILSGSKYNVHAGRNGPLKDVAVLSVDENEKCLGF